MVNAARIGVIGVLILAFVLFALPVSALAAAPHMLMSTGSYTGNGTDDRAIGGAGFQPDVVLIKQDGGNPAIIRTSTMADGYSKLFGGTALFTTRIKSFNTDGFTLGTNVDVNGSGSTYYWVAFKASSTELKVGNYTGDGTASRTISDVGWQPTYVMVLPAAAQAPVHATSSLAGTSWTLNISNEYTDGITAMAADGFTVGSNAKTNSNGAAYHYIAWKAVSGRMQVGSYSGNATDNRSITGLGFQPDWIIVERAANTTPRHKSAATGASTDTAQLFSGNANASDTIQSLESDGFQIGTSIAVNTSASPNTYYYIAFNKMFESYRETGHTNVWGTVADPYSTTYQTAYLYGDGFVAGHTYSVGFYDGNGNKIGSNVSGSLSGTTLSADFFLGTDYDAVLGTWHAVVFDTAGGTPQATYAATAGAAGYVVEDDFEVGASAIPEFPSVFAGLAVAGACAFIYYKMRRRSRAIAQNALV